jgi:hypothetical protein
MKKYYLFLLLLLLPLVSCKKQNEQILKKTYSGPYLGQIPPDNEPVLFAPGFVSTPLYTRDVAMMPDGNEIYFCVSTFGYNLIFCTKQIDGVWIEPVPASFIKDYSVMYYEPNITHDGKKMYFLSTMVDADSIENDQDIWVVERIGDSWGEPKNLGEPINTDGGEYFPSVTVDGTLYFTRQPAGERNNYIFRSKFINGKYTEPEKLGPEINCGAARYNAYVDRNEKFMIVPAVGLEDSFGGTDYYIVFRNDDDKWSQPINLGDKINTEGTREYSAYISPDNKYLFFMSSRTNPDIDFNKRIPSLTELVEAFQNNQNGNSDIYWVNTEFINSLRPPGF